MASPIVALAAPEEKNATAVRKRGRSLAEQASGLLVVGIIPVILILCFGNTEHWLDYVIAIAAAYAIGFLAFHRRHITAPPR